MKRDGNLYCRILGLYKMFHLDVSDLVVQQEKGQLNRYCRMRISITYVVIHTKYVEMMVRD